ncbi:unnamed protein product [Diatraea saccharalis]|uniref:CCHC-type domain-containing protein n=1 Tax=Diatraea saccharalis TaxID=40085 RepID=A0A9N9WEZ7_9NEOP|nr:unnamed protein product [Diatraea saccharalis]
MGVSEREPMEVDERRSAKEDSDETSDDGVYVYRNCLSGDIPDINYIIYEMRDWASICTDAAERETALMESKDQRNAKICALKFKDGKFDIRSVKDCLEDHVLTTGEIATFLFDAEAALTGIRDRRELLGREIDRLTAANRLLEERVRELETPKVCANVGVQHVPHTSRCNRGVQCDTKTGCANMGVQHSPPRMCDVGMQSEEMARGIDAGSQVETSEDTGSAEGKRSLSSQQNSKAGQLPTWAQVVANGGKRKRIRKRKDKTDKGKDETEREVTKRRKDKEGGEARVTDAALVTRLPATTALEPPPSHRKRGRKKVKVMNTSAVMVSIPPEEVRKGVTYKEIMTKARRMIRLQDLGIPGVEMGRAVSGALLLKVPGAKSDQLADRLASELRRVLDPTIEVTRPVKRVDMRITGLDEAVEVDELRSAISKGGGCPPERIVMGPFLQGVRGGKVALVRCPTDAASALLEGGGSVVVGWTRAKVQRLEPLPVRCYRCMGTGHVRRTCPAKEDRSGICFRCGLEGHRAATCRGKMRCAVCAAASLPANHVMGSKVCSPPPQRVWARSVPVPHVSRAEPAEDLPEVMDTH